MASCGVGKTLFSARGSDSPRLTRLWCHHPVQITANHDLNAALCTSLANATGAFLFSLANVLMSSSHASLQMTGTTNQYLFVLDEVGRDTWGRRKRFSRTWRTIFSTRRVVAEDKPGSFFVADSKFVFLLDQLEKTHRLAVSPPRTRFEMHRLTTHRGRTHRRSTHRNNRPGKHRSTDATRSS